MSSIPSSMAARPTLTAPGATRMTIIPCSPSLGSPFERSLETDMTDTSLLAVASIRTAAVLSLLMLTVTGCTGSGKATATPQTVAGTQQVCASCHGTDGRGVSPTFPRLAGQQPDYI